MDDISLDKESEDEKKRRERAAFEAYFINEREQEKKRNNTAMIWVLVFGVGIPMVFSIIYFIAIFFFTIAGNNF